MTLYDAIRYPTHAKAASHPDRLAAVATLFGMQPARVERCRVLEVGAGTGANLIPMAYGLPESTFLGVDLAEEPVAEGCRAIAGLGLRNIELRAMDLCDLGPSWGPFDYIIAHGLYSWVPAEVRTRLMEICAALLGPEGVAFISYNTYPGCHIRNMLREMLLYHAGRLPEAGARLDEARAFIAWLKTAHSDSDFGRELDDILERSPGALFHDDLAETNAPVYFHQFVQHAGAHGLQFLGEAEFHSMHGRGYALPAACLDREQYLDFLKLRRFRQTLLCHAGRALDRDALAARLPGLYVSCQAQPAAAEAEQPAEFQGVRGGRATTSHPLTTAVLLRLCELWPRRVAFEALTREFGEPDALAGIVLEAYRGGLLDLHTYAPHVATEAGERPVASPVARLALQTGKRVPTLYHQSVQVEDPVAARLLLSLDGSHDREALARELSEAAGMTVSNEVLSAMLDRLARLPLLIG